MPHVMDLDFRRIAAARDFNDLISLFKRTNRLIVNIGGGDSESVYNELIYHDTDTGIGYAPSSYACDSSGPLYRVRRYERKVVYGLNYAEVSMAYTDASTLRCNPPNSDGRYDWITGNDFLRQSQAQPPLIYDPDFAWHAGFGPKTWAEDHSAVGAKPVGAPDPGDGRTYAEYDDSEYGTCCNGGTCIPWFPIGIDATGWNSIEPNQARYRTDPMFAPDVMTNLVGPYELENLPSRAAIMGTGIGIGQGGRFFKVAGNNIVVNHAELEIKPTGLVKTKTTLTGSSSVALQDIGFTLLGRRIGRDVNGGYPCVIWEPCGGSLGTSEGQTLVAGKWNVVDCTAIATAMLADSPYTAFCLMPNVLQIYADLDDPRDVLAAMMPPVVTEAPADPDEPHIYMEYTENESSASEWMDDSGDTEDASSACWYNLSWDSMLLGRMIVDFSLATSDFPDDVPRRNRSRMT